MKKVDMAVTCDGVYGVSASGGDVQVQLTGVRMDVWIEENLEAIKAHIAAMESDDE